MARKSEKQNDWEATVQKARDAVSSFGNCSLVNDEIYRGIRNGSEHDSRLYLGRICRDMKIELVYLDYRLEDLACLCELREDLIKKGLEVVEYVHINTPIETIENKAKNLLTLSERLKSAQRVYIPHTAKIQKPSNSHS
jgi:hypothetical protein